MTACNTVVTLVSEFSPSRENPRAPLPSQEMVLRRGSRESRATLGADFSPGAVPLADGAAPAAERWTRHPQRPVSLLGHQARPGSAKVSVHWETPYHDGGDEVVFGGERGQGASVAIMEAPS